MIFLISFRSFFFPGWEVVGRFPPTFFEFPRLEDSVWNLYKKPFLYFVFLFYYFFEESFSMACFRVLRRALVFKERIIGDDTL